MAKKYESTGEVCISYVVACKSPVFKKQLLMSW